MAANARLRIAFARVAQETNALSPIRTTLDDFRSTHWIEGVELLDRCRGRSGSHEVPGFLRRAELAGFVRAADRDGAIDAIPVLSAWTIPSGPLERSCFDAISARLAEGLRRARPLDGVFLSLHGAMGVDGVREPEAELVRIAREASGARRVAVTLDLHANLTRPLVDRCDAIVAYATNPHRDHARAGSRAGRILIDALRGAIDPVIGWRSLPMVLGGGSTIDLLPPMRAIFRRARAMERMPRVRSASIAMCHPWSDSPELGWSALTIVDRDRALADALAEELADACWRTRDQIPELASADEAIALVHGARWARRLGVVMFADASDVVSAGAPGDSTHLIRAWIAQGDGLLCYAAIRDPEVVAEIFDRPAGGRVHVKVGGKLDPSRSGPPLELDAVVAGRDRYLGAGRRVLIDLVAPTRVASRHTGRVRLVITEGPPLAMKPSFFTSLGLSMRAADVVMVKNFFPFRLFFLPWARRTIYVRTSGCTDLRAVLTLPLSAPVHPRDHVADWQRVDARRRGVSPRAL